MTRTTSKRKAKGKTVKAFAIVDRYGDVWPRTCSLFKSLCIQDFVEMRLDYNTWNQLYKKGYRCLPVEIRVLKKGK